MKESKKLFSQRAITIATFFGGPAAAGYLIKKNYESFNEEDSGRKAFIIGIITTILIFAGIFSLPEQILDKIPNTAIPVIYSGIIYLVVAKLQGKGLKEHKEANGEFYSGWKATGIGAIFMLILLIPLMGIAFYESDLSQPDFDIETYVNESDKFIENENISLEVLDVITSAEQPYLIKEFGKGVVLWKENKDIINRLNSIENLPTELLERNKILSRYCDLRIHHYEMILKALTEETDKYISEIRRIEMELITVLDELE